MCGAKWEVLSPALIGATGAHALSRLTSDPHGQVSPSLLCKCGYAEAYVQSPWLLRQVSSQCRKRCPVVLLPFLQTKATMTSLSLNMSIGQLGFCLTLQYGINLCRLNCCSSTKNSPSLQTIMWSVGAQYSKLDVTWVNKRIATHWISHTLSFWVSVFLHSFINAVKKYWLNACGSDSITILRMQW